MIQVCWLRSGRRSQTRRRRKWHSRCSRQACEYALLGSLSAIIDKAAAHCVEKNYDEAWMLSDRLFPDMFTLARQIRQVSDSGRNIPGRLAGGELPRRHVVCRCQSTSGKIPGALYIRCRAQASIGELKPLSDWVAGIRGGPELIDQARANEGAVAAPMLVDVIRSSSARSAVP
jgi:hypothetical protein